jgi:hypothetical protein
MPARVDHEYIIVLLQDLGNARPAEAIVGKPVGKDEGRLGSACTMVVYLDPVGGNVAGRPV